MSRKQQPKLARGELRHMLPNRQAMTRKLRLGDLEGYVIVGLYEDGTPGEVFLTFDRVGSMERGLLNALALMISRSIGCCSAMLRHISTRRKASSSRSPWPTRLCATG